MNKLVGQMTSHWHRVVVAAAALVAGGAIAVAATARSTPARAAENVGVQAFTVPSSAYATPLGSAELPMTVNPTGTGEWLIVNGASGASLLNEPATGGSPAVVGSDQETLDDGSGADPFLTLAGANGYWWATADGGLFTGFTSSGSTPTLPGGLISAFKLDARDMTSDPSGNLYIPDHKNSAIAQALINVGNLLKSTGNLWTVPSAFSSTEPEAVAFVDGQLWFTTDSGQLGSFVTSNSSSPVQGPYSVQANGNGHTLTGGDDGDLWAVGGGTAGSGGGSIVRIDPSCGGVAGTYSAGLPANPDITAIANGPDGNIWFTESGVNEIGELDLATGTISNFPLPSGVSLPGAGSEMIASGPTPTGTMFFDADEGGVPAVGVISGLATSPSVTSPPSGCTTTTSTTITTTGTTSMTTPTTTTTTTSKTTTARTGSATVAKSAKVSSKGVASVKISCSKAGPCSGKLVLELVRKERVKVHGKTVEKSVTTAIGSAKYKLAARKSKTFSIKLSRSGVTAVTAAARHKLSVAAKLEPAKGKAHSSSVSLVMQQSKRTG
jgi:streptogramin lyase